MPNSEMKRCLPHLRGLGHNFERHLFMLSWDDANQQYGRVHLVVMTHKRPSNYLLSSQDAIDENNRIIAELMEYIDELDPPRPRVEISKLETKMNHTALALVASGLPIIEMGQDSYTGKFAITVDIHKNSTTTKADILRITRDLPVEITYEEYAPSQRPVPHQPDVVNQWLVILWLKIITIDRTALYVLDWLYALFSGRIMEF